MTLTHTGNTLEEVSLIHGEACLTVSCRNGGTIISTQFRGEELFARDEAYTDLSQETKTKGNPNVFPVFNQPL